METREAKQKRHAYLPFHAVRRMPYSILVNPQGRVVAHGSLQDLLASANAMEKDP